MNAVKTIRTITYIGLLLAVLIWGYLGLRYMQGGFHFFMVQSGSMTPAFPVGAVVVAIPTANVAVGDVITYRTQQGAIVTHRVAEVMIEGNQTMYVTKGDANEQADDVLVPQSMLIGKVSSVVPEVGKVFSFSKTLPGYIAIVIIPALYLLLHGIWGMVHAFRKDAGAVKQVEIVSSP